jgi:hypothetical protein
LLLEKGFHDFSKVKQKEEWHDGKKGSPWQELRFEHKHYWEKTRFLF